jgi:hypothetical protein
MFGNGVGAAAAAGGKQSLAQFLAETAHALGITREALALPIEVTFEKAHEGTRFAGRRGLTRPSDQ